MNPTTPKKTMKRKEPTTGPSPWKTPKKGRTTNIEGFVVLVGLESTSQNNNAMFDIMVQRAKSDVVMIRIMTNNVIKRDEFVAALNLEGGKVVVLTSVSDTADGMFFYNLSNGSSHTFVVKDLSFTHDPFTKFIKKLSEHMSDASGTISIECRIKYVGGVKKVNAFEVKEAILYDEDTEILLSIWNPTFWDLTQEKNLYFAHLEIDNFFGVKLKTMKSTIIMENENTLIPDIPLARLKPLRVRAMGFLNTTQLQAKALTMAEIRLSVPCPSNKCYPRGEINRQTPQGNIGKCTNCQG